MIGLFEWPGYPLFEQGLTNNQAGNGDVNRDGFTDIVDALITAQYYVGLPVPVFDASAADVDASGTVNIVGALKIAQYCVGIIDSLGGYQLDLYARVINLSSMSSVCRVSASPAPVLYEPGTEVTVRAPGSCVTGMSAEGFLFWTGDVPAGQSGTTLAVTMDSDKTLVAWYVHGLMAP